MGRLVRVLAAALPACIGSVAAASPPHGGPSESGPDTLYVDCSDALTPNERGDRLRKLIENDSTPGVVIQLCPGLHVVSAEEKEPGVPGDGIWIHRDGLTIQGVPGSVVLFERAVYVGFAIRPHVHDLAMHDFEIRGSLEEVEAGSRFYTSDSNTDEHCEPLVGVCFSQPGGGTPPTYGIGTYGGVFDVRNVRLERLVLRNLATGIDVGGRSADGSCEKDSFVNVTISDNTIADIHGIHSGTGYGIVSSCAENVLILDNAIRNTMRHAIYHGQTPATNARKVLVARNTVVQHGELHGARALPNRVTISLARGSNMAAVDNTLVDFRQPAISVEKADPRDVPYQLASGNYVIGNRFISSEQVADIWLNAGDSVVVAGNVDAVMPGGRPRLLDEGGEVRVPACWLDAGAMHLVGSADPDREGELSDDSHLVFERGGESFRASGTFETWLDSGECTAAR